MRPTLDPAGFYRRIPLAPHQLHDRITRTVDMIVLCHLGVPRLSAEAWRLEIDGLVERPLTLSLADVKTFPQVAIESTHQCAGFPLEPTLPTRRIVNVVWGGVRLADILAAVGPLPGANYVWSFGADYGTYSGVTVSDYVKDLPIARASDDVLLAWEVNGSPLPAEHGFPVRLVVPGFYGTNSVKWLTRLHLAKDRADGPFTTRWYIDPVRDSSGAETGQTQPVWAIAPECVISNPATDARLAVDTECAIRGWAWADGGIASVDVSADGGASWAAAELEPATSRAWQSFALAWTPHRRGKIELVARATGRDGRVQPADGARNAWHRVSVTVD
jgi:DMSO/TMAO reductase YedYZ molybdopterin-dependent catalytic subunit